MVKERTIKRIRRKMSYLSYIKSPHKKQELYALLNIYELYKKIIDSYLSEPIAPLNKDLNIFYLRGLVPAIQKLIKNLDLNTTKEVKNIKMPINYILFTSLLVAEKELKDEGRNSEDARIEVTYNYGKIKELVELIAAVMQPPIKEIDVIIKRGNKLIELIEFTKIKKKKDEGIFLKKKTKNSLNFDFPKPFEWGELELRIKNGKEDIEIYYEKKYMGIKNYIELGFSANKKNHKPNRAWELLVLLSIFQNENITKATPDNLCSMFKMPKGYKGIGINKNNIYKIKQLLSSALNEIFNNKDDPFTEKKEYYEPILKIQPEPELRHDEIWSPRIRTGKSQEPLFFKDNEDENPDDDETLFNDEDSDNNEEY